MKRYGKLIFAFDSDEPEEALKIPIDVGDETSFTLNMEEDSRLSFTNASESKTITLSYIVVEEEDDSLEEDYPDLYSE